MRIQIKRINEKAKMPSAGSERAAGYDLYACLEAEELRIAPHQTVMVGTGLAAAIPDGYFGGIFARSGLAAKQGLRPANCVGVVDADYRGEIKVALHNDTETEQKIADGERIAQLVVMPFLSREFELTAEREETERGAGGFGHTGRN